MRRFLLFLLLILAASACKKRTSDAPADNGGGTTTGDLPLNSSAATYFDESGFASSFASYGFKNPSQIVLKRSATASGYNSVYGFAVPASNQVKGFKWNDEDEKTQEWRPQGITGFSWAGKSYLLVSWYAISPNEITGVRNEHKGVRLALVDITDMNDISYNYILLVQNISNSGNTLLYDKPKNSFTQLSNFIPVTMHAGGLAYYNQKIYIVDTSLGLRVYDLNQLVAASADATKNTIGKDTDGSLKAFDYEYILPQSAYYKITNGSPFSCVSLGEGSTPSDKRLWTAQYQTSGGTAQVLGFPISSAGVVSAPAILVNPKDDKGSTMYGMQGVYRAGNKTYVSKTGNSSLNGSTARLAKYVDGANSATYFPWAHGAEDLHLDDNGLLWSLTEFEYSKYAKDNRCVFAVRLSDY
ncbi:MAG: hypothetical protein K0S09_2731 [Sphingobacteriaceae bacterium]|nr:hypothetical protein [Sphingobacteriaceae bacterium]